MSSYPHSLPSRRYSGFYWFWLGSMPTMPWRPPAGVTVGSTEPVGLPFQVRPLLLILRFKRLLPQRRLAGRSFEQYRSKGGGIDVEILPVMWNRITP